MLYKDLTQEEKNQLLKDFGSHYNYMYENGYKSEYVAYFDDQVKNNPDYKDIVCGFVKDRGDYISSDREAAAFCVAYNALEFRRAGVM